MSRQSRGQAQLVERQKYLDAISQHLLSASTSADESKKPAHQAEEAAKILRLITEKRLDDIRDSLRGDNRFLAWLSYLRSGVKIAP